MALNKIKEWQLDLSGINAKIEAIGKPVNFKGRVDSVDQLPEVGADGDLYYVGPIGSENKKEYIWYDGAFELVGSTSREDYDSLHNDLDELGDQVSEIESKIPAAANTTNQLADKAYVDRAVAAGGGGGSVPDNVYTQDNLIAGKNVTFTEVPPEGGIDEHTLACWHFDDGSIDVVKGITNTAVIYRADRSKFGNVGLSSSTPFSTSEISVTASEEWTIDFWYLPESGTVMRVGFGTTQYIQINNSGIYFNATGKSVSFQYTLSASEWAHCALQNKSGLASVYINGKLVATDEYSYTGGNFYFCSYGYLDELRVSNIARYTEDFTPPTEPYTLATGPSKTAVNAIVAVPTKTSELENDSGFLTGLPDNVYTQTNLLGGKDIEIVPEPVEGGIDEHTLACWHFDGNKIDEVSEIEYSKGSVNSSYIKFGTGCLFNSNSAAFDISSIPYSSNKDISFDCWCILFSSAGASKIGLVDSSSYYPFMYFYASGANFSARIRGTSSDGDIEVSEGVWHHLYAHYIAKENKYEMFVDGKKIASKVVETVFAERASYCFGRYIDELRISDCVRWTEDFEPPTKPYSKVEPTGNMVVNFVGEKLQKGADYVVESYSDDSGNWYRVYKSGWIEQGGYVTGAETYTLLKPMMDTNYIVLVTQRDTTAPTSQEGSPRAGAISTTQIYINGGKGSSGTINYYVCGQGA